MRQAEHVADRGWLQRQMQRKSLLLRYFAVCKYVAMQVVTTKPSGRLRLTGCNRSDATGQKHSNRLECLWLQGQS